MNANPQLKKSYGTPIVLGVRWQTATHLASVGLAVLLRSGDRRELTRVNYGVLGFSVVPRPVAGHGLIFICTSFMQSQLQAIKYDGKSEPTIAWKIRQAGADDAVAVARW